MPNYLNTFTFGKKLKTIL